LFQQKTRLYEKQLQLYKQLQEQVSKDKEASTSSINDLNNKIITSNKESIAVKQ
jgi:hypothetical protein